MRIIRGIEHIEKAPCPIVAVGNFDGLHLGHQRLLKRAVKKAREVGGTSIVFTFEPHPLQVLLPEREIRLLTSFREKMKRIEDLGIQEVIVAEFTLSFAARSGEEFVENILSEKVGAREVFVGWDFAFGRGRTGRVEDLKRMGEKLGFGVTIQDPIVVDGEVVSSSRIRDLLQKGQVAETVRLLGRYYAVAGEVGKGEQRGRELGFPTANLIPPPELIPCEGVYSALVAKRGRTTAEILEGIVYIGSHPTFGKREKLIEVHLFGVAEDLYGERLVINFHERIREEMTFRHSGELVKQIETDVRKAKELLTEKADRRLVSMGEG